MKLSQNTKLIFMLLGLAFVSVSCGSDDSSPAPEEMDDQEEEEMEVDLGIWTTAASAPTARKEIANASVEVNGSIYIVGGVESNGTISSKLEIYDIENNTWSTGADLPEPLWRLAAASNGDEIFVFGGYRSLGSFPFDPSIAVYAYNIASNSWTQKSNMPIARGAATAVTLNDQIHLIGGASSNALARNDIYDPIEDHWTSGAPMSVIRSGLTGIEVEGKIYVFGGYDLSNGVVSKNTAEVYSDGSWSSIASLPVNRLGIDAAAIGSTIYVIGGSAGGAFTNLEYNIDSNEWRELTSMPTPVSFMGVEAYNNKIFAIGGGPVNLNRTDAVSSNRVFTPAD